MHSTCKIWHNHTMIEPQCLHINHPCNKTEHPTIGKNTLLSESFICQQMHFVSVLENIIIYIKTAPTCFGLRPSSGSLHMSLAKVTFIKSVKVSRYGLCGCVAACYIKSMVVCVCCVLCAVCCVLCTAHSRL